VIAAPAPWTSAIVAAIAVAAASTDSQRAAEANLLSRIDHLVYATPDLGLGVDRLERLLGVRASPGGQHQGRGTRNALIALGPAAYIEVIGPDPEQPPPPRPRMFGVDRLTEPKLVTWAAKTSDLARTAARASAAGAALGAVAAGSRTRPDGLVLTWRFTDPATVVADGIVPFFIDWGTSPHPAKTAAAGCTLIALRAEHPDAARVKKLLDGLELPLPVTTGSAPALTATIDSPKGRVELR
jgi:glyoxalase-like protein